MNRQHNNAISRTKILWQYKAAVMAWYTTHLQQQSRWWWWCCWCCTQAQHDGIFPRFLGFCYDHLVLWVLEKWKLLLLCCCCFCVFALHMDSTVQVKFFFFFFSSPSLVFSSCFLALCLLDRVLKSLLGVFFFWRHRLSKWPLSVFGVTESGAEISRWHYFFQSSSFHMCKRSLGSSLGYCRHHSFELFSCTWRIYVRNPRVLGLGFGERVGTWSGKRNFVWWLFAGSRVQAFVAEELQTKPLEEDNETHEQTWSGTLSISSTTEINQTKYPFLWCTGLV